MHVISLDKIEYKAPSKWSELTAVSLLTLARYTGPVYTSQFAAPVLVAKLFNVPMVSMVKLKQCQVIQLEPLISWIYRKNDLNAWLLKSVKTGSKTFYGPKDRLSDMTAEEFMYAEAAYERWVDTQKDEYLHTLFAVLFRKKQLFTENRKNFRAESLDKAITAQTPIQLFVKKAVAINYAGCRNLIIQRHPHIWKTATDSQASTGQSGKTTNWAGIILDLSGDKFGTYAQTIKTNLWLVLADMDKKAKQCADLEARNR